jgi:hypothetical protein
MPPLAALWLLAASVPLTPPATLILFRDQAEPLLFKPVLSVDGVEVGRLGQNRFIAVELAAGPHRVEARWPGVAGHKPAVLTLTVVPGAVSYVELTGTAAFRRTAAVSALVERPPADGETLVAACCKPAR